MSTFHKCQDIPNRSNLPLQICLWLNVYLFIAWSLTYISYILSKFNNFWNFEGIFVIIGYIASNIFELLRLHSGYSGNLKSNPMHLNRFLILTPLILLPLLLFLLISAQNFLLLISLLTYSLFVLMLLEFIFGVFAWQKLCVYQSEIYKMKREMIFESASHIDAS